MRADQVVALYADMEAQGIRLWLMGGWGVDALLGRQTREHHDLDVLIDVASLERLRHRLQDVGFDFKYVWDDEAWRIKDPSWSSDAAPLPTAFVYGSPEGLEIDVHVIRAEQDGSVSTLWTVPYEITPAGLEGRGAVQEHPVRCLTADMQQIAHTGYDLPPHHVADLQLLAQAAGSPIPPTSS